MYNKAGDDWRFRQTGVMIDIPEAYGSFFIGRTKEAFSTSKMMVGYQGWTNERASINDAFLPILADGIKWQGYTPGGKIVYRLGFFKDTRSQDESFNKNDQQSIARVAWLPFGAEKRLLHLVLQYRRGRSNDGTLQYRSKPESYLAQEYAIDTGKFAADHSNMYGVEAYYRPGPLMYGMEYMFNQVSAPASGDPFLHGGEIFAAWSVTGETRPYNARGSYFEKIEPAPARSVFSGGPGAWEVVLRGSYANLDDAAIQGGTFWRITPMVNWHMSGNVRLEFVYGYGMLDRFGIHGATQFFQTRLQLQL
jgi:phosphate-selective porin OprO/OprP